MSKLVQITLALILMWLHGNADSDDFLARHRLFYSPQQRLVLDAAQQSAIPNARTVVAMTDRTIKVLPRLPPALIFNGYLKSPDGELLWINGMPWDHRFGLPVPVAGILELAWQTELRRLVVVDTMGDVFYLQPGESMRESVRATNQLPGE